ncbi:MAG: hypothetical protein PHY34_02780 [Patescibacteria group bacterium]|nr:hypothetical protein [Patescibacteria group bacterium]MDD5715383.1 hypothetical protein [Patescibacteria group bacterium]
MDFIYLAILFVGCGLLSVVYYCAVPPREVLAQRLPNKPSVEAVVLTAVLGATIWYIIATYDGVQRIRHIAELVFALLFFESAFLFFMRWLQRNIFAVSLSLVVTVGVFYWFIRSPNFFIQNGVIIIATLGAATLLVRLKYLKSIYLFILAALWIPYDFFLVSHVLPAVTTATAAPQPTFLYPAVTVGVISLGVGDFMFMTLFTLVLLRDFNGSSAIVHLLAQGCALLITGLLVPESGFIVPFMVVMTPIFFAVYIGSYIARRRQLRSGQARA